MLESSHHQAGRPITQEAQASGLCQRQSQEGAISRKCAPPESTMRASYWARSLRMVRIMIMATMQDITTTTIIEFRMLNQCTCGEQKNCVREHESILIDHGVLLQRLM